MNTAPSIMSSSLSFCEPASVVDVMLDRKQYQSKPPRGDSAWRRINYALANNRESINISELAHLLTQGCSFTPGVFSGGKRTNDTWVQQQVFALDFDHDYRIEEFLAVSLKWGIKPTFMYPTFNHTEQAHRFRAVFVHDTVVTDMRLRYLIQGLLMLIFPKPGSSNDTAADKQCIDPARIFCGTDKPLIKESFDARINAIELLDKYLKDKKQNDGPHYADWEKRFAADFGIAICNRKLGVSQNDYFTIPHSVSKTGEISVLALIHYTQTPFSPTLVISCEISYRDILYEIQWSTSNESKGVTQSTTPRSKSTSKPVRNHTEPLRRLTDEDKEIIMSKCRLANDFASSSESVGPFRLRKVSQRMK